MFAGIAQAGDEGSAGVHSNFIHGVGARALALGNAYVAVPFDASAIYWNPAGMDYIDYKNATSFYTNLPFGTNFYFLGYVHPTIISGAFGVGIVGYGGDGVDIRDGQNVEGGTGSYSEQIVYFAYGKQLPWKISGGVNFKIYHQNLLGNTATSVGMDLGFLYRPDFTNSLLSGLSVGMTIQNFVGPRMKAGTDVDIFPVNVRLGLAKPILTNEWGPQLTFFMDVEQGERVPFKYHAGTEYVFQNKAMLRVGMNNNQLAFGIGATFQQFQLDYSFGKFASHELNSSHRISFTVKFGKSKDELIQIAENKRIEEIQAKVDQELYIEREQKIDDAMRKANEFFKAEDYARANREYTFVAKFEDDLPGDSRVDEAKKQREHIEQTMEQKIKQTYAKGEEKKRIHEEKNRLNQLHKQAMAYFEEEYYEKAIEQWEKMLDISPGNPIATRHIEEAKEDIERKLLSLINRADALAKQKNYYAAIRVLDSARRLNPDDKRIQLIDKRVSQYDKRLNFDDLYQQGYRYYMTKDYKNAKDSFGKALAYQPGNKKVKKYFLDSKARANAKKEPLTGAAKEEWLRGTSIFRDGKYKEALKIWEALLEKHPYNKYILDNIDMARERIDQQKRSPYQP